eukprot:m51a1_g11652 hypothetical protein (103) ;mRNA; f:2801-8208
MPPRLRLSVQVTRMGVRSSRMAQTRTSWKRSTTFTSYEQYQVAGLDGPAHNKALPTSKPATSNCSKLVNEVHRFQGASSSSAVSYESGSGSAPQRSLAEGEV